MVEAIATRKKDVVHRLSLTKVKREERAAKEEEARQRAEDRAAALVEAKEKWDAENREELQKYADYQEALESGNPPELEEDEEPPTKPIFDENFFFFNWDEEHPGVDIPPEVVDDVDNDWALSQAQKEDLVA